MSPLLDDVLALLGLVLCITIIGLCLVAFAPDIAAAVTYHEQRSRPRALPVAPLRHSRGHSDPRQLRRQGRASEGWNTHATARIEYVRDIRLTFEQPPIPMRDWDWRAMHDGDDEEPSRHGWGRTPEEALADLKQA